MFFGRLKIRDIILDIRAIILFDDFGTRLWSLHIKSFIIQLNHFICEYWFITSSREFAYEDGNLKNLKKKIRLIFQRHLTIILKIVKKKF